MGKADKKKTVATRKVIISGIRVQPVYSILSADGSHVEDRRASAAVEVPPVKKNWDAALADILTARKQLQDEIDQPIKQ